MCGRFALYSELEKIIKHFSLAKNLGLDFKPSYNIAPLQKIYVV
jgi:putative SOS response-associated peptidase YedK